MSTELFKGLDNSAFTKEHKRIYSIVLLGHLCDGFDINLMGFVLPAIIATFNLTGASAGFLASAVFFGMFLGAAGGGLLADAIGRKTTIIVSLCLFGLASFTTAAASTYWSLWITRLIGGTGLGAEVVLIFSYLVELLPVKARGTLTSSTVFFWQISSLIAALVAIVVIPNFGWRGMFVIGGAIALISAVAWLALPESIRFLVGKGRLNEARDIAIRIGVKPVEEQESIRQARTPMRPSALLGRVYLKQTVSVWAMQFLSGFAFFGIAVWLPTLLIGMGFSFVHSLLFTGIITGAGAVGNVVAGFSLDRWGRRPTIIIYFVVGGFALILWGISSSALAVIVIGAVGAFFSFGTAGALFTYVSELYPTPMRATGVGISGSWQRVGGVAAPYILGILVSYQASASLIFAFVGALMLVGGIIATMTVIETKMESLEEIQDEVMTAVVNNHVSPAVPARSEP
jgi:MFS transporter, putative metabolite:H+ symporter